MGTVKIRLNTWQRKGNRETKFKRNTAAREAFIDYDVNTKQITLKQGSTKWKPWDTGISRSKDTAYINDRKEMYSGLCFENKKEAQAFMQKHKATLDKFAAENPLFDHWSVMNVIKRFEPHTKKVYGKDIKEEV